ncbi:NAD(P)-dependent oxidoreductase [Bradyrhizobium sp. SYSU BS000235]|uniref:NAD(P)-dependent oxidoreductase n=1 Tax=Bradyrhizobium sp. SYSU BS000235 TaxID=3411332 RepID=UPI003C73BCDB
MDKVVGVVGIGIMGTAMARNLRQAGFTVVGYDPVPAACARLQDMGGQVAASPRAVAEAAPIILMSLPNAGALTDTISGADGIAGAAGTGQIVIECSTLPMDIKRAAFDAMANGGKILLDCPISGTGAQAVNKDLVILGSGDKAAFDRCADVFTGMSRVQHYLGPFGNGSVMKYIANHLVTINNVAAAEAMMLGMKAGIDPGVVYNTLADSAGTSRMFQMRGPLMRDENYDTPTATIRMQLKDISIIDAFAADLGCALPVYAAASQIYHAGKALGRKEQDTAAVCAVLETMHGFERKKPA